MSVLLRIAILASVFVAPSIWRAARQRSLRTAGETKALLNRSVDLETGKNSIVAVRHARHRVGNKPRMVIREFNDEMSISSVAADVTGRRMSPLTHFRPQT
jgi:hypothetical protein